MNLEETEKVQLADDPKQLCNLRTTNDTDENGISTSSTDNTISMETRDLSQSLSKFRGRWEKAKLRAETDLKNTKCSLLQETECSKSENCNSLNKLECLQPAAVASYEKTMKQLLHISSPISVRLESFNVFDHIAQALAVLQFERDAMKALGRLEPTKYELMSKKLAAELNQMRRDLWIALMEESVSEREQEDRRKQLERQLYEYELKALQEVVFRRKEEERKTEEVEKDRRNEERKRREEEKKLNEVEMLRRDEERKCKEVETKIEEAKQQLSDLLDKRKNEKEGVEQLEKRGQEEEQKLKKAQLIIHEEKKTLMEIEMKRGEEEKKVEDARRTVEEAECNLQALKFQFAETQKKLLEVQVMQSGLLAVAKAGERKHTGGDAASKDIRNSVTLATKESAKERTTMPSAEARKKLTALVQKVEKAELMQLNRTALGNSAISHRVPNSNIQENSGTSAGSTAKTHIAFPELPSLSVAIHMGLSRTRVGLFRPGTTEFQNIADVENCFYYRDDSILLAYNESDKQKLKPPGLNFESIIMQGPVDFIHHVNVNGKDLKLRKEHIMSHLLALLKLKAEVELGAKLPKCVIVVPQFLNEVQRACIRYAAEIAGFSDVKLVDDTVAMVLEYMMRKKERDRYLIATCASDGIIDVAKFRIKNGILQRIQVSGTHFLSMEQGKSTVRKLAHSMGIILSNYAMSTEQTEDILQKIFNNNELDLGKHRFDMMLKLFTGDTETINKIKNVMKGSTNFVQVSEGNVLGGGAFFAAICEQNPGCPIYRGWKSMTPHSDDYSMGEFKAEVSLPDAKEKKRSSNFSEGKPMTVMEFNVENKEGYLQPLREVRGMALKAMTVSCAIKGALKQKQLQKNASAEMLIQLLAEFSITLQQPNLRLEEAKIIHDDLLSIWYENIQGRSGSY